MPTSILTLNWANETSAAHNLDAALSPIDGKSREGFVFGIDLQVQIHVPDSRAPKVISMVGTMQNLVNEVLQSAVGNYFRNALQELPAVQFIETRDVVQARAQEYITGYLMKYDVETRGVYVQDVIFPPELVAVLTEREIANQERVTFEEQQRALRSARVVVMSCEANFGPWPLQRPCDSRGLGLSLDIDAHASSSPTPAQARGCA